MSTPAFTFTSRARPIIQIGLGSAYVDVTSAQWDLARWDTPGDEWSGAEPEWRDVTCDSFAFTCEYGRQRTTDRFVAGAATVVVYNATGWADPNVIEEVGTLTMRPGRAIRVGVLHVSAGTRWLFRGFIDAMTPVYDPTQPDTVELSCVDALGEVNRTKTLPLADPLYGGDTVDVRIGRLLDAAAWPDSKRLLSPTGDTLIASDMGGQLADLLGQAADSGGGNVFGDLDANIRYRARDWQVFVPGTPPDGTIGNVEPGHTIPGTPQVDGFLSASTGSVSTPDTADMAITGPFRLTMHMRIDALTGTGFPAPLVKANGGREHMIYVYPPNEVLAYSTINAGVQIDAIIAAAAWGNLHYGVDTTLGIEVTPGSAAVVTIVDRIRNPQTLGAVVQVPNTTAPLVLGAPNGAGVTGRIYSAQLERLDVPGYLTPTVGTVSTPDPGPLPNDCTFVYKVRGPSGALEHAVASQFAAEGQRSWVLNERTDAVTGLTLTPNGLASGATNQYLFGQTTPTGSDETLAVALTLNSAGRMIMRGWQLTGTSWAPVGAAADVGAAVAPFDSSSPVEIGAFFGVGNIFNGRIYSVELRAGLDPAAGTVLWRFDANDYPGTGTSYVDPRGRTWTLTSAAAITPKITGGVVWRFDANEYPGTGTSYVDPRGRTWTLTAASVITPKIAAVPDVVIPGDVCPVHWERPFARSDLATRVIIGRDTETAQQLDDDEGQILYGIEPFERTDLLTERDDKITQLGQRILRVRSALAAPRIRSVTLAAQTADDALDLMSTVDVFKPSRYRCRLQYPEPRGLVFDAEHIATGVAHDMSPESWTLALNLDLAEPYAAAGGRWDGAYWDQATWAS